MGNSGQIFFEDVAEIDELEPLSKGPLTTTHLMRWSAAMENWHKIHYDKAFAVEHDELPDLVVNGTLKQQFILQMLKNWAGPHGWVWKVGFQFRAVNVVGDTLSVWATVSGKAKTEAYGLVELKIGIKNAEGTESTPGTATIALPYREGAPVPYPFVPPEE